MGARVADRSTWGKGPWDSEPDREEFQHEGFPCLVNRGGMGAWCGYVAVPPGHWAYGKGYSSVNVSVHGGLTYAGQCSGSICHVPAPGEPDDVWWLGFDANHWCDLAPDSRLGSHGEYRDIEYVKEQCRELVAQLKGEASLYREEEEE